MGAGATDPVLEKSGADWVAEHQARTVLLTSPSSIPSLHRIGWLQLAGQPLLPLVVEAQRLGSREWAALALILLAVWLRGLSP